MIAKEIKKFIKKCNAGACNASPFDTIRESSLHDLASKGQLFAYTDDDRLFKITSCVSNHITADNLAGIIVARELGSEMLVRDFAQRRYKLPAGSLYVSGYYFLEPETKHFAAKALYVLSEYFHNNWLSIQIYPECGIKSWFERNGFERALTKVSAFAEVKAIYTNTNVECVDLINPVEDITLACVRGSFMTYGMNQVTREEIGAALAVAKFANHYSIYNKDDKWSGLSIRGYGDPSFIEKPTEMSKQWKEDHPKLLNRKCADTAIAPYFSHTLTWLHAMLSQRLERVRILRLDAGGQILRHCDIQDKEAGLADGKIARFHVPLKTNATEFTSWNAEGERIRLKMDLNSLCYLDHRKPHAVVNLGDTHRLHLVVDVWSDTRIRRLISEREYEGRE